MCVRERERRREGGREKYVCRERTESSRDRLSFITLSMSRDRRLLSASSSLYLFTHTKQKTNVFQSRIEYWMAMMHRKGAITCRLFSAKEPLITGLFGGKSLINIRRVMHLRHPVSAYSVTHTVSYAAYRPPCLCTT